MAGHQQIADGVFQIDVLYPSENTTCCYLIRDASSAALVDCGGRRGAGEILQTLAAYDIPKEQVKWLILSHPHLDHAGCAGALMRELPNVSIAAHASTIKHLSNPEETLLPAVRTLYGMPFFEEHYGEVLPLVRERTKEIGEGDVIKLDSGRALSIIHTPGHAWSHLSVYDEQTQFLICGDTFGVSYRDLDTDKGALIIPVTPPSQFDPEALAASVAKIKNLQPKRIGVSHFGTIAYSDDLVTLFVAALEDWVAHAPKLYAESQTDFLKNLTDYMLAWIVEHSKPLGCDPQAVHDLHKRDVALSVLGFQHWLKKNL